MRCSRKLRAGLIAITLVGLACGPERNAPTAARDPSDGGTVSLKLAIPAAVADDVARVDYLIAAAAMDTMRGELVIGADRVARGTVAHIPPGPNRTFVLAAYAATDSLTYWGSATADVVAGHTVGVHIQMRRVTGAADITGEFDDSLPPVGHPLIGSWRLDIPGVSAKTLDFVYAFAENGGFTNRIGGAFLKPLQDLDELQEIDLGGLDQFDGGLLNLRGTWTTDADSLRLTFDGLEVELVGSLPLIGDVSVDVADEGFDDRVDFELGHTYSVNSDRLLLRGNALTLGVAWDDVIDDPIPAGPDDQIPEGVSVVGEQALRLLGDFLKDQFVDQATREFALTRIQ